MRSGLPDGLVFWFFHGDVRSVTDGLRMGTWYGTSLVIWYGISLVFRVWYIVGVYGMVHS